MGNGYHHHHHLHHQNLHFKVTFLPILCSKPSIKDVSLPKWKDKSDPLSPKIGCMGQVKRNNKIVGCPVSHKFNNNSCNNGGIKYFKLNKLFSGKNLTTTTPSTATAATTATATTGCRRKQVLVNKASHDEKENSGLINIENMDPPLPVIKRVVPMPKQGDNNGDGDTLWQRRSRGVGLRSLQIQQIQLSLNRHQEPITV